MIVLPTTNGSARPGGDTSAHGSAKPHAPGAHGLIQIAAGGGSDGGKCTSLLLDKPEPGEKNTVVHVEGEDVLSRFDLTGATVDVEDGAIIVRFPDGAVLEIIGLEDPTVLGEISPAAGEENNRQGPGNNGHGTGGFAAGTLGGDGDVSGLGSLGALTYTELEDGSREFILGQQQFLLPPELPTPELGSVVSIFASVVAPSEANPVDGEGGLADDPDTTISFLVNLSQPSELPVEVNFAVIPGSAQAGSGAFLEGDFSGPLSGTLTFAPGETTKVITLNIVDDFTFEPSETFTIQLSSPVNAALGNAGQGLGIAVGTIIDNDPVPSLVFGDNSGSTAVEGDLVTFALSLANPSFETIVVNVGASEGNATEGADFNILSGSAVTFLPGETTAQVSVSVIDDGIFEGSESFTITAQAATGEAVSGSLVVTIDDVDSVPVLSISSSTAIEGDDLVFALSLSTPSQHTVVLSLEAGQGNATEGSDFGSVTGTTVSFLPGETSATVTVSTIDDALVEGTETFKLSATLVAGQAVIGNAADAAIINTDFVPTGGSASATVREAGNEAVDGHFAAGTAAAGDGEIATGSLGVDFSNDGPAASQPFTWLTTVTSDDPETAAPNDVSLTSGGHPVVWQVSDDGLTLSAVVQGGPHDGQVVATLTAELSGSGAGTGVDFHYEQIGPLDHPDIGQHDAADPIRLGFSYTIKDQTGDTATGTLAVDVLDDAPADGPLVKETSVLSGTEGFNLAFVIDISNSMRNTIDSGETRLQAAITALESVLKQAESAAVVGPVMISAFHGQQIPFTSQVEPQEFHTTFASIEAALQEVSPGVSAVEDFFNQVFAGQTAPVPNFPGQLGSTRYEGGLDAAADWFTGNLGSSGNVGGAIVQPNTLQISDNRLFFLTDGGNNNGTGGFNSNAQDVEKLYNGSVPNLTIKTVGIEAAASFVEDLDRTDDLTLNDSVVIINDLQAAQQIASGFGEVVEGPGPTTAVGNLLLDDDLIDGPGQDGSIPAHGADGSAGLTSFSFLNGDGLETTVTESGAYTTFLGGTITVDFTDGSYQYKAPSTELSGIEHFTYTINDGDGDPLVGQLDITVTDPSGGSSNFSTLAASAFGGDDNGVQQGGAGDDTLVWNAAASLIDGGPGTDTLRIEDGAQALLQANDAQEPLPADFKQVVDFNALTDLDERINSIEVLQLAEESPADQNRGTEVRLDASDVIEITDQTGPVAALTILSSSGDAVDLLGSGWSGPTTDGGFHSFSQSLGGTLVTVRIDDDIALSDIKTD